MPTHSEPKHFRAVVHIAAVDVKAARKVADEIERGYLSADPAKPYVTVLSLQPKRTPPGKRGWR